MGLDKLKYTFLLLSFGTLLSYAHERPVLPVADSAELDPVWITAKKHTAINQLDILILNQSQNTFKTVGELLQQNGLSVRSSGMGVLTLASIRGLYGNQINVLWEGLNIQSPMNGNFDLSLLPAFFVDQASLLQHNHSSLSGNAALSGSISLNGKSDWKDKAVGIYAMQGSFGQQFLGGEVRWANNKLLNKTRVFRQKANFDYPIKGYENSGFRERQANNDFLSKGFLQENGIKFKNLSVLNLKVWYQESDRGIPESITVQNPESRQQDVVLRAYADYIAGNKFKKQFKAAFFDETILFEQNPDNIFHNRAQTFIQEANAIYELNPAMKLSGGLNHTLYKGMVQSYDGTQFQQLASAFISLHLEYKKLKIASSVRQQTDDNRWLLPAPSLGLIAELSKKFSARFNSGFSYRVPTFNDRFWTPGGNLDLLPEESFKSELGLDYAYKKSEASISVYQNEVKNLIVWLPGASYWEAMNVRRVRVLGAETKFNQMLKLSSNSSIRVGCYASINLSRYVQAEEGNTEIVGNQLIFIPIYMANAFVQYHFKDLEANLINNYTGQRFTSTDNTSQLPSFNLLDVTLNYKVKDLRVGLAINNIFSTTYQLHPGRPLPGRNFQFNLSYTIQYHNKNENN